VTWTATALERLPRGAFWFDASRDGSRIAFAAYPHGRTQVYVMAADGTGVRVVTHDRYEATQPALSPDASTLAYVGFGGDRGGTSSSRTSRRAGRDG
jgi:Tol biopolymer transport system component